jgi:CubicO group peptidase (beta-lactamase class C family)
MRTALFSILLFFQFLISSGQNTDAQMKQIMQNRKLMGMSVVAVCHDSIIYNGNFGLADFYRNIPITDSTLFRIASISKTVAATALMMLYEKKLFTLDEDIGNILGYKIRNPKFPDVPITPRMLLSHTSSLFDGTGYGRFITNTYYHDTVPALSGLLTDTGSYYTDDIFLDKKPGTYFIYTNLNFGIIGTLVEKLSGVRYDIYCRENIFKPLGLNASYRVQDISDINNLAVLYRATNNIWQPQADNFKGKMPPARKLDNYVIGNNAMIYGPHAALRISAPDLSKLMIMQMNGGIYNGIRILQDSTVKLMHKIQWKYNGKNGDTFFGLFRNWGLGFQVTSDIADADTTSFGCSLTGHIGDAYGLLSDIFFNEKNKFGIVFITNGSMNEFTGGSYSAYNAVEEDVFESLYNSEILPSLESSVMSKLGEQYKTGINLEKKIEKNNIRYYMPYPGDLYCRIYDSKGKLVSFTDTYYGTFGRKQVAVSTAGLPEGLYYCLIQSEGNRSAFKISVLKDDSWN